MKAYLSTPPILVSPKEGKAITLYLVVSNFLVSATLVREENKVQKLVYFCSKALRGAKK